MYSAESNQSKLDTQTLAIKTNLYIFVVIQQKEKTKRESILGKEFAEAIAYLNQFLPKDKQIRYIAWDMSRASKR